MVKIYHNPRCSKSRQTLELLKQNGQDPEVIEYLKTPPTESQLTKIIEYIGSAKALVRVKEGLYKELQFDLNSHAEVAKQLAKNPSLMERPVVVNGSKAAIGRPPENVLDIL